MEVERFLNFHELAIGLSSIYTKKVSGSMEVNLGGMAGLIFLLLFVC